MRTFLGNLPRSASLKVGIIAALILALLFPVSMIQGVIWDRDATSNLSRTDIMQSWGGEQTIAGPILIVPYEIVSVTNMVNGWLMKAGSMFCPINSNWMRRLLRIFVIADCTRCLFTRQIFA